MVLMQPDSTFLPLLSTHNPRVVSKHDPLVVLFANCTICSSRGTLKLCPVFMNPSGIRLVQNASKSRDRMLLTSAIWSCAHCCVVGAQHTLRVGKSPNNASAHISQVHCTNCWAECSA